MKTSDDREPCGLGEAAIICFHVANGSHPILQAVRTQRIEPADSGWQFLCNSGEEEDASQAKVWTVGEVLEHDDTLHEWIESPFGTTLLRRSTNDSWFVWEDR